MRPTLAIALLLSCAACSQEAAPAEQIVEAAEAVVDPTPAPPQGKWAPRDECGAIEGAAEFRRRLEAAVQARDVDAFAALAAEDIKLGFGGSDGREQLRASLTEYPAQWDELDKLLALGCAANDQGGVTIPWYADQDPGEVDVFEGFIVTAEDVPVFRGPDRAAERLAEVSWDLVTVARFDPDEDFQQVALPDGAAGYVATDKLRSLIDYRLIASSRNDRWSILAFLAGD